MRQERSPKADVESVNSMPVTYSSSSVDVENACTKTLRGLTYVLKIAVRYAGPAVQPRCPVRPFLTGSDKEGN